MGRAAASTKAEERKEVKLQEPDLDQEWLLVEQAGGLSETQS